MGERGCARAVLIVLRSLSCREFNFLSSFRGVPQAYYFADYT
jgi:hypothetical protein